MRGHYSRMRNTERWKERLKDERGEAEAEASEHKMHARPVTRRGLEASFDTRPACSITYQHAVYHTLGEFERQRLGTNHDIVRVDICVSIFSSSLQLDGT
jgi:hypothetical protein